MRWPLTFALALAASTAALSYISFSHSFQEYEQAQVLVVGRVLGIQLDAGVREPDISSTREVREATATVEVLRSRSLSDDLPAPGGGQQMLLRIYRHVDGEFLLMNGPSLPAVEQGRVHVFPLRGREGALWRLVGDIGDLSTLHASEEPLKGAQLPATSRDWLLNEIVGTLAQGKAEDIHDSARDLHMFIREEQASDFFARLEAAIGDDEQRLARLQALFSFGQPIFGDGKVDPPLDVVKWASERLAYSPQRASLIAETLLDNMELANRVGPLLEAADQTILENGVRHALREGRVGALYLAQELLRRNHPELLSDAMARAFQIADDPSSDGQELPRAGHFILERGSDAQQKAYALLVRKYRDADPAFYSHLWQSADLEGAKNAGYVLAVVLEDRRIAFRDVRYADWLPALCSAKPGKTSASSPMRLSSPGTALSNAL